MFPKNTTHAPIKVLREVSNPQYYVVPEVKITQPVPLPVQLATEKDSVAYHWKTSVKTVLSIETSPNLEAAQNILRMQDEATYPLPSGPTHREAAGINGVTEATTLRPWGVGQSWANPPRALGPLSLTHPPAWTVIGTDQCHPQRLCEPTHRLTVRLHCPAASLTPGSARPRRGVMSSRRGGASRRSPRRRRTPQRPLPSLQRTQGGPGEGWARRRGRGHAPVTLVSPGAGPLRAGLRKF